MWGVSQGLCCVLCCADAMRVPGKPMYSICIAAGRWREDLIPRALCIAIQIDEDVYTIGGDLRGDGDDVQMRDLIEVLRAPLDRLPMYIEPSDGRNE